MFLTPGLEEDILSGFFPMGSPEMYATHPESLDDLRNRMLSNFVNVLSKTYYIAEN